MSFLPAKKTFFLFLGKIIIYMHEKLKQMGLIVYVSVSSIFFLLILFLIDFLFDYLFSEEFTLVETLYENTFFNFILSVGISLFGYFWGYKILQIKSNIQKLDL